MSFDEFRLRRLQLHLAGRDRRVGRGDLRLCRRKLCDGRGTFLHHGRFAFAHLVLGACDLRFGIGKLRFRVGELLFGILDLLSGLIDFLLLLLTDARLSCFRLAGKKFDELVLVFLYAVAVIIRPIVEMFSIVVDDACDHRHLGVEFRRHGHGV